MNKHTYTFTVSGNITVTDDNEEIAYGWVKTLLEEMTITASPGIVEQIKDLTIANVELDLEETLTEEEIHEDE